MSSLPSVFDSCKPRREVLQGELPDALFAAELWDVFTRKQYAPSSPFDRNGTWTYQLDYMFWRYFKDEFTLGPPLR